ncbi:MAG: pilus assembly PilX N-terminal domain-containing protein [Acidobacteriia bacterium]|nr:pilus assembly PilX N-terminal domain-containing protein [Terriglobia bacterium]
MALITALIFLGVAMLLGLSILLTTSSDVFLSSSMRNTKTAFYAADAGVSVMRKTLVDALKAQTPASGTSANTVFDCSDDPTSAFNKLILNAALANAGNGSQQTVSSYSSYGDSAAAFTIDTRSDGAQPRTFFKCINRGKVTPVPIPPDASHNETYNFAYQITSNGTSGGLASSTVIEQGTISYNFNVNVSQPLYFLSGFGMLLNNFDPHNPPGPLPSGRYTGPAHTNGEWGFTNDPPGYYEFTDQISSVSPNAYYVFAGPPPFSEDVPKSTDTHTTGRIAPIYDAGSGVNFGAASVQFPTDSSNQLHAVIDGSGYNASSPFAPQAGLSDPDFQTAMHNTLVAANSSPYNGANGVYIPVSVSRDRNGNPLSWQTRGGGIFVNGNVDNLTLDARTPGLQIYIIVQGGLTTTLTYNLNARTTTIQSGASSFTAPGLPTNNLPFRSPGQRTSPATSISFYVNGSISSMHGPVDASGQQLNDAVTKLPMPGVQDGAAVTITATGDVEVTGSVLYRSAPVTTAPANTAGTLIPANDYGQALGIYSQTGNIYLNVDHIPSHNIEVDAALAAVHGTVTWSGTTRPPNVTIIGGRVQNQPGSMGIQNTVLFDRRFGAGLYAPPFFPYINASNFALAGATYAFAVVCTPAPCLPKAVPTSYSVPSRMVAPAQ